MEDATGDRGDGFLPTTILEWTCVLRDFFEKNGDSCLELMNFVP